MLIESLLIPGYNSRLCWLRVVMSFGKILNADSHVRASWGLRAPYLVARAGPSVQAYDEQGARLQIFRNKKSID